MRAVPVDGDEISAYDGRATAGENYEATGPTAHPDLRTELI